MEEETTSVHNRSKYLQEYEATQSQSRPGTPRTVSDNSREAAQTVSTVPSTFLHLSSANFVPYDEEVEEDDRWEVEEDDDWGQGICGWDDSQVGLISQSKELEMLAPLPDRRRPESACALRPARLHATQRRRPRWQKYGSPWEYDGSEEGCSRRYVRLGTKSRGSHSSSSMGGALALDSRRSKTAASSTSSTSLEGTCGIEGASEERKIESAGTFSAVGTLPGELVKPRRRELSYGRRVSGDMPPAALGRRPGRRVHGVHFHKSSWGGDEESDGDAEDWLLAEQEVRPHFIGRGDRGGVKKPQDCLEELTLGFKAIAPQGTPQGFPSRRKSMLKELDSQDSFSPFALNDANLKFGLQDRARVFNRKGTDSM
ncbi:hypothetical protein CYMTET_9144 [Cymbomonas tetramitiformis]|uniref:Uncharacterized protein n=1 Tax=Cymbomonas tetramitiformis TaxID=36881 RepID=A0AAE0GRP1_9CHLO|nr:hypothetical protein CYMTET_9144 [Cymbomonas tetramitiformis]